MYKQKIFKIIRIITDMAAITGAYLLTFLIRYGTLNVTNIQAFWDVLPYLIIGSLFVLKMYDLYANQLKQQISEIFYALIPASFVIALIAVALSYFFQTYQFPRSVLGMVYPVLLVTLVISRYIILKVERYITASTNIVIIGTYDEAEKLKDNIKATMNGSYNLKRIIGLEKDYDSSELEDLKEILTAESPNIIFLTGSLNEVDKKRIFRFSLESDWEISLVPDFYEIMLSGSTLEQMGELPLYSINSLRYKDNYFPKRIVDVVGSSLVLLLTLPLTIAMAIAIKIEDGGPIVYAQQRLSKDGKPFNVYKFRTMIENAEKKSGPVLADEDDNRVTKVGKFMRKTRIDEIPQLINVLKGDMSLIGPRPERPVFVEEFEKEMPEYKFRHHIKSGVTGLAQIYGYYSSDVEDKLRMDLLYANKTSIVFDIKIILQTIKVMMMGHRSK